MIPLGLSMRRSSNSSTLAREADQARAEAEEAAVRHALGGILAGGEAVETASGKHLSGGPADLRG